jgi:hypothetical protein
MNPIGVGRRRSAWKCWTTNHCWFVRQALIALGEIALFRDHLDLETVLPQIQRFANDPELGPYVEDSLDNIRASKIL